MFTIPNTPCGYQERFNQNYAMDFILLHKILDNEEYRYYYLKTKGFAKNNQYRILDNSCYELRGKGLGIEEIVKWAQDLDVDEIVLPDVYQDKDATLQKIAESIAYLILKFPQGIPFKLQAIPQGKNQEELILCLEEILKTYKYDSNGLYPAIHCIGINKLWNVKHLKLILEYNLQKSPWVKYHKLGTNKISDWFNLPANLFRSADSRVLSKLVVGHDDIWEAKLSESQISILSHLISHFNACGFSILHPYLNFHQKEALFNDPVEPFNKRK